MRRVVQAAIILTGAVLTLQAILQDRGALDRFNQLLRDPTAGATGARRVAEHIWPGCAREPGLRFSTESRTGSRISAGGSFCVQASAACAAVLLVRLPRGASDEEEAESIDGLLEDHLLRSSEASPVGEPGALRVALQWGGVAELPLWGAPADATVERQALRVRYESAFGGPGRRPREMTVCRARRGAPDHRAALVIFGDAVRMSEVLPEVQGLFSRLLVPPPLQAEAPEP